MNIDNFRRLIYEMSVSETKSFLKLTTATYHHGKKYFPYSAFGILRIHECNWPEYINFLDALCQKYFENEISTYSLQKHPSKSILGIGTWKESHVIEPDETKLLFTVYYTKRGDYHISPCVESPEGSSWKNFACRFILTCYKENVSLSQFLERSQNRKYLSFRVPQDFLFNAKFIPEFQRKKDLMSNACKQYYFGDARIAGTFNSKTKTITCIPYPMIHQYCEIKGLIIKDYIEELNNLFRLKYGEFPHAIASEHTTAIQISNKGSFTDYTHALHNSIRLESMAKK